MRRIKGEIEFAGRIDVDSEVDQRQHNPDEAHYETAGVGGEDWNKREHRGVQVGK